MRTTATWISLGVMGLALSACQPKASTTAAPAPAPAAAPVATPVAPATPAVPPAAAVTPDTVLAVTQALAAAQAFNASAAADLAAVLKAEKRIHDLAGQASEGAARAGGGIGENERLAVGRRVAAARTEAEAAHADLAARQATFRVNAQTQTDAVAAAQLQCAASPEFTASEPCVKLTAEQAAMAQAITTLTARFVTAEAGYQKDRQKLEEASATMALGIR